MKTKSMKKSFEIAKTTILLVAVLLLTASAASASFVSLGKETNPPDLTVTDGDEVTYYLTACNPTDTQGTELNQTLHTITDTYPDGSSEVLATDVHLEPGECWTDTTTYTVTGTEELEDGKMVNGLETSGVDEADDDISASVEHRNPYEEPAPTPTPTPTQPPANDTCKVRLYGEEDKGAATPYTDPEAPFDPQHSEAPEKDFMTFNPAVMDENNMDDRPVVSNVDSKQKVFARQWFVPNYTEPTGKVWLENPNQYVWEDVVTEYTYMFVDKHYDPTYANGSDTPTEFYFPVADNDDQIGLDGFDVDGDGLDDMTTLKDVGDYDGDGRKDISISAEDLIVEEGDEIQFLDHMVKITGLQFVSDGDNVQSIGMDVYYTGNKDPEKIDSITLSANTDMANAGRHSANEGEAANFAYPWWVNLDAAASTSGDKAKIEVGRLIHTNESFFVDAAEYYVAMIYGPGGCDSPNLKYITLRNPVPEHQDVNLEDLSVTKMSVDNNEMLPLLPPFNKEHSMIDDIGIPHNEHPDNTPEECEDPMVDGGTGLNATYNTVEERRFDGVGALDIYFTGKDTEDRFHTNLAEILKEEGEEWWEWKHIQTMPDFYKEFVYPSLPDVDETRGDFLLTSSWRAPNSCCERVMMAFDQDDECQDLYVNDYSDSNRLRLYGEEDKSANFPYNDPEAPFNPQSSEAPRKDFVTFNPAVMDENNMDDRIVVSNTDSKQKMFARQWFVPNLTEPVGEVWLEDPNEYFSEDVVTEYTYMFVDKHYDPTFADDSDTPTKFYFPVADNADQIGLDGFDVDGDGLDDRTILRDVGDYNGDGRKDINISAQDLTVEEGDEIQFLDHMVKITGLQFSDQSVAMDIYYTGNKEPEKIDSVVIKTGEMANAGRHDAKENTPADFYRPWYVEIQAGASTSGDRAIIDVGRLVHTGETFFVDAAEYDVAMIYGPQDDTLKYITLRNPIPENYDVEFGDTSVTKMAVNDGETLPLLPPFNMEHDMIDDVDVPHEWHEGCNWYEGDAGLNYTIEERRISDVSALDISFTGTGTEDRFHTNLVEILDEGQEEGWKWKHIHTMPDFYKEFVYPDLPDVEGSNGDFLVTSSFVAPNTECDACETDNDMQATVRNGGNYCYCDERVNFAYEATDGTGLYLNGNVSDNGGGDGEVSSSKGDFDGDCDVDFNDFMDFAAAYETSSGDANYNEIADFDDNGEVDFNDFMEFAAVYNTNVC
ncbi:MAG: hypothetical protein R6U44_09305 [Archaeoglobaceae archaeon]